MQDGRYFVVRGRLWRMANPKLDEAERAGLVDRLMAARQAVRDAKKSADREAKAAAHRAVDKVKRALGERGPVWWDDGSPDLNRHMAKYTPYADWYARSLGPWRTLSWQKPLSSTWTARFWTRWIFTRSHGRKLCSSSATMSVSNRLEAKLAKGGDKLIPVFLSPDEQRDHGKELEEW
jgi:hypothetical protein